MSSPINQMIDAAMACMKCGTKGIGNCPCNVQCSCGWWAERGKPCGNPATARCSTKVRYALPHLSLKKGERVALKGDVDWQPCDAIHTIDGFCGTVAATPRKGRDLVSIRWDGRTSCDRVRIGWLDRL